METLGIIFGFLFIGGAIWLIFTSVEDATNSIIKGPHWNDPDYVEEIVIRHEYPEQEEYDETAYRCTECDTEIEYGQAFCGGCGIDHTKSWEMMKEDD